MSAAKREALRRFLSGSDLLAAHEPRKEALLLDEVVVTALLNHPALFDHVNAIGASQRAEPVRHQNPSGPVLSKKLARVAGRGFVYDVRLSCAIDSIGHACWPL